MNDATRLDLFHKIIKHPGFYPLLPRHRVYLFAPYPSTKEEGKRFARLFIETWKQIPLGPRRAILRHWRSHECTSLPSALCPMIELLSSWSGQEVHRGGHGLRATKAAVSPLGNLMKFCGRISSRSTPTASSKT